MPIVSVRFNPDRSRAAFTLCVRHAAAAARLGLLEHVRATLPKLERLYLDDLMRTHDAAEGVHAFADRRQPRWTDE